MQSMKPCLISRIAADATINKDGSLTVQDHGRGMPTGMHAMEFQPLKLSLPFLHAGGKGQGGDIWWSPRRWSSVVNALSSWLEVEITRVWNVYKQRFGKRRQASKTTHLKRLGQHPSSRQGPVTMPDANDFFFTTDFKYNTIFQN